MTSPSVHMITGIPFMGVTFNASTSTFTLAGSNDYTSVFQPNYVLTVTGTSTSNDGYYSVVSSTYTGGHTVVTVQSYSTGTAYPGTVPFVSSGTGRVIWFNVTNGVVGLDWTSRTSPTTESILGLATSGGVTLITDQTGSVYKSTDGGHTWAFVSTLPDGVNWGTQLDVNGTTWISSGGNSNPVHVDISTNNGTSWTSTNTGVAQNAGTTTIVSNHNGTWVIAGNAEGGYIPGSVTSGTFTPGETITQATTGATESLLAVAGTSQLIIDTQTQTGSPDATHIWTGNSSGATFTPSQGPIPNTMAYSTDNGATWTTYNPFQGGNFPLTVQGYGDSSAFLADSTGGVLGGFTYSTNGISWTFPTITNGSDPNCFTKFGGNYIVGDGATNAVIISSTPAGIATTTETPLPALMSAGVLAIAASSTMIFAIDATSIYSANSTNGTTWGTGLLNFNQTLISGSVASGTFTPGETITQSTSGATAMFIGLQTYPTAALVISQSSITGTPDGTHTWTGNSSGATFTPSGTPATDTVFKAVYDSTNNSFIAVGNSNGSVSTYP